MSSSDEDVIQRPARGGRGQAESDAGSEPASPAPGSDAGNLNFDDDDDADLFGSDGSDPGFGQDNKCASQSTRASSRRVTFIPGTSALMRM
jgi:RNA polymerase-associated protein LEO1